MSCILEEAREKEDKGVCLLYTFEHFISYLTWHNPEHIMSIIQMRKPRLWEFKDLCRVFKLLNDRCYFHLRSVSSKAYALPNIPHGLILPIPTHQHLFSILQALGCCPPTVSLIATTPFILHTLSHQVFFPLIRYPSSSQLRKHYSPFKSHFLHEVSLPHQPIPLSVWIAQFGFCECKLVQGISFLELFSK